MSLPFDDEPGAFDDMLYAAEQARDRHERAHPEDHDRQERVRGVMRGGPVRPVGVVEAIDRVAQGESVRRRWPCTTCSRKAATNPAHPIADGEEFVKDGRVYHRALCANCTDIAWSKKFAADLKEATAHMNVPKLQELESKKAERLRAGRKVYV